MSANHILAVQPKSDGFCNFGSADQITSTVASLLAEYFKPPNRTVFWSDDLKMNVDPFDGLEGTFFSQNWDFKVKFPVNLGAFLLT